MATNGEVELPRGGGEAVLAVDDVAALRRLIVRQLTDLGYRPFEAADAAAALRLLEQERIDLLLTDVVMAHGETGFELADAARRQWPGLRVVFSSGFSDRQLQAQRGYATAQILQKPFRMEQLARALRAAFDAPT